MGRRSRRIQGDGGAGRVTRSVAERQLKTMTTTKANRSLSRALYEKRTKTRDGHQATRRRPSTKSIMYTSRESSTKTSKARSSKALQCRWKLRRNQALPNVCAFLVESAVEQQSGRCEIIVAKCIVKET